MKLTHTQILERLEGACLKTLSKHTGIEYNALYRLKLGLGRKPSTTVLNVLSEFYLKLDAGKVRL